MFEEYLQDASALFDLGKTSDDERISRRYYRATVFYSYSALEAFINQISETLYDSKNITKEQYYFLIDKKQEFSATTFKLIIKDEYHRVDEKIKLIIKKYSPKFNFANTDWTHLIELKKIRDSLMHPKNSEDQLELNEYVRIINNGLNGVIATINNMNQFVYRRPLRLQILDLRPD